MPFDHIQKNVPSLHYNIFLINVRYFYDNVDLKIKTRWLSVRYHILAATCHLPNRKQIINL